MRCSNCGAENSEDAVFCGYCGVRQTEKAGKLKKRKRRKAAAMIGCVILIALAVGGMVAGYLYLSAVQSMEEKGNSEVRHVVEYNDKHYYMLADTLYKCDADGTEGTTLLGNLLSNQPLWLVKGKLFLLRDSQVISYDLKTESIDVILNSSERKYMHGIFGVHKGKTLILYSEKNEQYQLTEYNMETGMEELIDSNVIIHSAEYVGDTIVYVADKKIDNSNPENSEYGIYIKKRGSKARLLLEPEQADTFLCSFGGRNEWLYFENSGIYSENKIYSGSRLKRINLESEVVEILFEQEEGYWIGSMYLSEDYIFHGKYKQKLYQDDTVGEVEKIDVKNRWQTVDGNVIYFPEISYPQGNISMFAFDLILDVKEEVGSYRNVNDQNLNLFLSPDVVGDYVYQSVLVTKREAEHDQSIYKAGTKHYAYVKINRNTGSSAILTMN